MSEVSGQPRSDRRAPSRRAARHHRRPRRQELGAQADGGDDPRRRHVRAVQRAEHRRRRRSWASCWRPSASAPRCRRPAACRLVNDGDLLPVAPYEQVERIRASINVLGPLLTRCGRVRLSMPGGDDFGARPIDMHVAGLEAMGAEFKFSHGELEATADRLHGADDHVRVPQRRGDREHRHRRRVRRRGHHRSRTPPGNPRSSTSARCSSRWGPTSRVSARHGWWCAASSRGRCGPPTTAPCPTASRPPPTSPPSRWPAVS